jgi:D-beta-D-heptose 7-phosphate kinase/D-beta-D-heptose 1-phosphate adenosyltransferase
MNTRFDTLIQRFPSVRVVVVGDLMLDRYVTGRVRRISPEAPVPVVEVERTFDRPGGAGNVAANAQALGARTTVVGVVGADPEGDCLRQVFAAADLTVGAVVVAEDRPTITKTRVVAHGQQIVRVDREQSQPVDDDLAGALRAAYERAGPADVVILSDYAKGVLTNPVCAYVIEHARARGVPVVVDPKGRDYRRYAGATAITPNQHEAAQALGGDGLDGADHLDFGALERFFLRELALDAALITQSERGMTLLARETPPLWLPATARDVADVTGAGDTAVTVFALCLAAGTGFRDAAYLANCAAGLAVGKAGAATVGPDELLGALTPRPALRSRRA